MSTIHLLDLRITLSRYVACVDIGYFIILGLFRKYALMGEGMGGSGDDHFSMSHGPFLRRVSQGRVKGWVCDCFQCSLF